MFAHKRNHYSSMKPKEIRNRYVEFEEIYAHFDQEEPSKRIYGNAQRNRKQSRCPEENQIESLKRKRFRTPHEL